MDTALPFTSTTGGTPTTSGSARRLALPARGAGAPARPGEVHGGTDVSFIARGAHLEAMRRDGLRIEGGHDPFLLEDVCVTGDPGELGPVDLVMVCVKLWDTEAALEQLRPLVGPETTLVAFQNGVLKDSILKAAYDEEQLIGGVAYVASTVSRPGVITRTGPLHRLIFGEFDGHRSDRVEAFHAACVAGGIDAELARRLCRHIPRSARR